MSMFLTDYKCVPFVVFILNCACFNPAQNVKMPIFVGILTFISRINTASGGLKA